MRSNYRRLGDYIREIKVRNYDLKVQKLLGINIDKYFMPSVANVVGTDMTVYKIVKKNQFACNRMHVGRDYRLPISMSISDDEFLVSPAYDVFEIIDSSLLNEFLMLWFMRPEFDRNAWFFTDEDIRGGLSWKSFCDLELPVPSIEKQREIVAEYNAIQRRIELNEQLIQKLEDTAQTIYKRWFVEFEFPNENGLPYKSNGGEMVWNEELSKEIPKGWEVKSLGEIAFYQEGPGLREWQWTAEGMKVINVKNIMNNGMLNLSNTSRYISLNEFELKYKHFSLKEGDIVIASSGNTYGKVGKILQKDLPLMMNTSVIRFNTLNQDRIPINFLYSYLNSSKMKVQIENSITGSAQPNFGPSHIKKMKLEIPNISQLKSYNLVISYIYDLIENLWMVNFQLTKLKEVFLSKLATLEG